MENQFEILVAGIQHLKHAQEIVDEIERSAKERGTGIAKRTVEYVQNKMLEKKAIVAIKKTGEWAGFCYIETWSDKEYVANSGLIVKKEFRNSGLAKAIKQKTFEYSRDRFPDAKLFGLTTGLAVMKINSELGYKPVTYSQLTQDDVFWKGCESCVNFPILQSKNRSNCLCTALLYVPEHIAKAQQMKAEVPLTQPKKAV